MLYSEIVSLLKGGFPLKGWVKGMTIWSRSDLWQKPWFPLKGRI